MLNLFDDDQRAVLLVQQAYSETILIESQFCDERSALNDQVIMTNGLINLGFKCKFCIQFLLRSFVSCKVFSFIHKAILFYGLRFICLMMQLVFFRLDDMTTLSCGVFIT